MTDHFAYLLEDETADFFQKEACIIADSQMSTMTKTASREASRESYSFEKISSRVDGDLFMLKTAGPCGIAMGMSKRASSYFDHILDESNLDADEIDVIFDKIASESISVDLSAAREELYKLAGGDSELLAAIDEEIGFVGFNMAKLATIEKEAIIAAAKALMAAGRSSTKALAGRGVRAVKKGVRAAPSVAKKGITAPLRAAAKASRSIASKARQARLGLAERRLKGIGRGLKSGFAVKGTAGSKAFRKSLQESRGKELAHVGKLMKNPKYQAAATTKRTAVKATTANRKAGQITQSQKRQSQTATRTKKGLTAAKGAAKAPAKTPQPATKTPQTPTKTVAEGAKVKLGDAAKKMRDQGWGSLSGDEKQKLINAGLAGVVGHRVVMGKGAVTGGEGIV